MMFVGLKISLQQCYQPFSEKKCSNTHAHGSLEVTRRYNRLIYIFAELFCFFAYIIRRDFLGKTQNRVYVISYRKEVVFGYGMTNYLLIYKMLSRI